MMFALILAPVFLGTLQIFVTEKRRNFLVLSGMSLIVFSGFLFLLLAPLNLTATLAQIGLGFSFSLQRDMMGSFFAFIIMGLWLVSTIYALGYMADQSKKKAFFFFYTATMGIALGLAFSANLITYYLFYELLTLITYPLVVKGGSEEAKIAGKKYLIFSFMGAGLVLLGAFLFYHVTGSWDFTTQGILPDSLGDQNRGLLQISLMLLFVGFGVKTAIMPFHHWLIGAMVAPTPVSALLHAVAVVKAGVFGIIRVLFFLFGPLALTELGVQYLAIWCGITIILGSIMALQQDVLKKRLAYSTISQLSYIPLGALLLSPESIKGGLFHFFAHAVMKITLFFCVGIITHETGCKKVSQLDGMGLRLPRTFIAFSLAAIGLTGIPFTVGFISKWQLLVGSLGANKPVFFLLLLLSSLLNAAYFFPIISRAFFKKGPYLPAASKETSAKMLYPTLFLAVLCFIFGIFYSLPQEVVENIFSAINY